MLTPEEYYRKTDLSQPFQAITRPNWRHFRFSLPNGRFEKIKRQVRDGETLKDLILKRRPLDVYYSTSTFLTPTALTTRSQENRLQGIFLGNGITFDIDVAPFSIGNLEKARKETLKLISFMVRPPRYIAFSGSKGFHVIYDDLEPSLEADPYKREMETIEKRKELVKKVADAGITIDAQITVDTRRIIRVPGSIHPKTGYACTIISKEGLESDIKKILQGVPRTQPTKRNNFSSTKKTPIKTYHCTYLSNAVTGIKNRYVMFIEKKLGREKALEAFAAILEKEALPHLMIFKVKEGHCGVCLKTYQRNELMRMLRRCGSENLSQLQKYRQNFLLLDMSEPGRDARLAQPIAILKGKGGGPCGKGHVRFFSYLPLPEIESLHGDEEVKLTYAIETA